MTSGEPTPNHAPHVELTDEAAILFRQLWQGDPEAFFADLVRYILHNPAASAAVLVGSHRTDQGKAAIHADLGPVPPSIARHVRRLVGSDPQVDHASFYATAVRFLAELRTWSDGWHVPRTPPSAGPAQDGTPSAA